MPVPQLPVPVSPKVALQQILLPAWQLLPPAMSSIAAQVFVLAVCLHEGGPLAFQARTMPPPCIANRWQVVKPAAPERMGPARGIAQFEKGGVQGVMTHEASRFWLHQVCIALGVPFNRDAIWQAMASNDALAACAARLLAFTDPRLLPALDDAEAALGYYVRNWGPGAWTRGTRAQRAGIAEKFASNHAAALAAVQGTK